MNIAIVSMVSPKGGKTSGKFDDVSDDLKEDTTINQQMWTESEQGLILSAFYWSYITFQMPMGSLAERMGGKMIICICLAGSAMVNLITPLVTDYLILIILLRFILGAVQAGMFPAAFRLQVNWMPISDRSLGFACMDAGATIGSIIAFFTSGFLIESFDWPCLFYVSGSISLIILAIFAFFVKSHPEEHSFVTEGELNLIRGNCKCSSHYKHPHQRGSESDEDEKSKPLSGHRNDGTNFSDDDEQFTGNSIINQTNQISVPNVIVTTVLTGLEGKDGPQFTSKINQSADNINESVDARDCSKVDNLPSELPQLLSPCVASAKERGSNASSNLFSSIDRKVSVAISVSGEKVPWSGILTNVPVIVTGLFKFAVSWNFMVFYTKMPSFLKEVANVDITSNGVINAMNNICIAVSLMTFGYVSEKIIQSGWFTRTKCRKFFAIFSGFCQATAIASIPYMVSNSNLTLLTILLFAASFCNGCQSGSDIPLPSEMTKAFPATLYALLNIIATSTGIIVPPIVAFILDIFSTNRTLGWSVVFYMSATLTIVSTIIFMIFSSAERQPFDFAFIGKPYFVNPLGENCDKFGQNENMDTITTCTTNDTFHEVDLADLGDESLDKESNNTLERLTSSQKVFAFNCTRTSGDGNWFKGELK